MSRCFSTDGSGREKHHLMGVVKVSTEVLPTAVVPTGLGS
jgi:hypothetical protein